jgi:hypothetical protein
MTTGRTDQEDQVSTFVLPAMGRLPPYVKHLRTPAEEC